MASWKTHYLCKPINNIEHSMCDTGMLNIYLYVCGSEVRGGAFIYFTKKIASTFPAHDNTDNFPDNTCNFSHNRPNFPLVLLAR